MKKIILSMVLLLTIFSCTEDETQIIEKQTVNLKFKNSEQNLKSTEIREIFISSEVEFIDGLPKLTSNELVEISVINSLTNRETYAYVLRSDYEMQYNSDDCEVNIERGYMFTGRCFVYGSLLTGSDCTTFFLPCGFNCIGFDDICPNWNEAFA